MKLSSGASFPFPGETSDVLLPESVLQVDFNYDFKTDLVLAGASGVRFMRQDAPNKFTDVTAATKLPKSVTNVTYTGAWAADIEADGDLDIVMGTKDGAPKVLRNNGDDTFKEIEPFAGISGLRGFAWADFDGDGNADAAIIDGAEKLHIFHNERQGQFREVKLPELPTVKALGVADPDNDGILDLVAVESSGTIATISYRDDNGWSVTPLVQIPDGTQSLGGEMRLQIADLDNNGAMDLILSSVGNGEANGFEAARNNDLAWRCGSEVHVARSRFRACFGVRCRRLKQRGEIEFGWIRCFGRGGAGNEQRVEELSLAGDSAARGAGRWRSEDQSVWRWRGDRDSIGIVGAETAD